MEISQTVSWQNMRERGNKKESSNPYLKYIPCLLWLMGCVMKNQCNRNHTSNKLVLKTAQGTISYSLHHTKVILRNEQFHSFYNITSTRILKNHINLRYLKGEQILKWIRFAKSIFSRCRCFSTSAFCKCVCSTLLHLNSQNSLLAMLSKNSESLNSTASFFFVFTVEQLYVHYLSPCVFYGSSKNLLHGELCLLL